MCVLAYACVIVCQQTERPDFHARKDERNNSHNKKVRSVHVQDSTQIAAHNHVNFTQQGMKQAEKR